MMEKVSGKEMWGNGTRVAWKDSIGRHGEAGIGAAVAVKFAREAVNVCPVARDASKLGKIGTDITNNAAVRTSVDAGDRLAPQAEPAAVDAAAAAFCRLGRPGHQCRAAKRANCFTLS
jgi:hypothetical protein